MANVSYMSVSKLVDVLSATDTRKDMYVRVLSTSRLALGADPLQPSHMIDLSKEKVGPYNPVEPAKTWEQSSVSLPVAPQMPSPNEHGSKITRRSGSYWLEINGRRFDCRSLKELLSDGLRTLEIARPGTLEKLSHIKLRSKRIVAHDPVHLFDKEHLTEKYSERLMDGWWYGTNNSAGETNAWLERACSCAGLKWGEDLKVSLTQTDRSASEMDL